jgi:hypothetical protein
VGDEGVQADDGCADVVVLFQHGDADAGLVGVAAYGLAVGAHLVDEGGEGGLYVLGEDLLGSAVEDGGHELVGAADDFSQLLGVEVGAAPSVGVLVEELFDGGVFVDHAVGQGVVAVAGCSDEGGGAAVLQVLDGFEGHGVLLRGRGS